MIPLSKEFLKKRGYCCNNGCKNCPYKEETMKDKIKKMFNRDAWVGWVIVVLAIVFIYMSIEPWMNDREEFIRIMVMVLGGGLVSTILIMWFMEKFLPRDDYDDHYEKYIREEYDEEDK